MNIDRMLERCQRLEERAAALYHRFVVSGGTTRGVRALWTALAREEDGHARSLAAVRSNLSVTAAETRIDGWDETLAEIERCLAVQDLSPGASVDQQLSIALDLEMTELEALRQTLLSATGQPEGEADPTDHAVRLADAAETFSTDSRVRLQTALLRARERLTRA